MKIKFISSSINQQIEDTSANELQKHLWKYRRNPTF